MITTVAWMCCTSLYNVKLLSRQKSYLSCLGFNFFFKSVAWKLSHTIRMKQHLYSISLWVQNWHFMPGDLILLTAYPFLLQQNCHDLVSGSCQHIIIINGSELSQEDKLVNVHDVEHLYIVCILFPQYYQLGNIEIDAAMVC